MFQRATTSMDSSPATIKQDMQRLFSRQQMNKHNVAATSARQRSVKLRRLHDWIMEHRTAIHEALAADFLKPTPEVDLSEIWFCTTEIKHTKRNLARWMKPRWVKKTLSTLTASSRIQYEPRGVVLIISPWNYPFSFTVRPLIFAIAAGNCVILKPSELSPNTSRLITQMVDELFPEDEVAVFQGNQDVAIELLKKPFDHIFFTGSTATGKKVMRAASENLTSITLELGGKSPTIIDETAHISSTAKKIVWGKYLNCGQTCIAPDYLLVQVNIYHQLLEALAEEIKKSYGSTEIEQMQCKDYARIIDDRHFERLSRLITDTLAGGAKIEVGGHAVKDDRYIAPTILSSVSPDSAIMEEEIFGPVLPVIPYNTIDEAISIVNSKPKPLALYIFSSQRRIVNRVLADTSSGGTCINDVDIHFLQLNLPFGGVNHSGMGSSHGYFGFKAFSHERAILKHIRYSPILLLSPPYTKIVKKLIGLVVKYL